MRPATVAAFVAVVGFSFQQNAPIPAFPTIELDLHAPARWTTWLLSGYLIVAAVSAPLFGKLGDRRGKRRTLIDVLPSSGTVVARGVDLSQTGIATGLNSDVRLVGGGVGGQIAAALMSAYVIAPQVPSAEAFTAGSGSSVPARFAAALSPAAHGRRPLSGTENDAEPSQVSAAAAPGTGEDIVSTFERIGGDGANGRADPPVRITLRPLASPLPLGFFAFAIGSFVFTCFELGWVAPTRPNQVALIMVIFVAPLDLVASILAFWARDPGGATALGLFGMTWGVLGVISLTSTAPRSPVAGIFLLCMSAVILAFGAASISSKPVLSIVGLVACARFLLTGIFQIHGGAEWERASGWVGLPLSASAYYLALALMIEDAQHRTVLPLLRRGAARKAVESHLGDQTSAIEREAGVRGQL